MRNFFTKLTLLQPIFFLLFLGGFSFKANAQCPVGETEVTISFIITYGGNSNLDDYEWNYVIQGVASDLGPFEIEDTVTVCVPHGDLTIIGCGDGVFYSIKVEITEDGSLNGCNSQMGCELYYNKDGWYFYYPEEECGDSPGSPIYTFPIGCDNSRVFTEGCTNEAAPNYNPCAIDDDGTCELETNNSFCENALPVEFNGCVEQNIFGNIENNTFSGLLPSCANITDDYYYPSTVPVVDIFYEIVPQTGNFKIVNSSNYYGVTIYENCTGEELYCTSGNLGGTKTINGLPPGETVILQIWHYSKTNFDFCLEELPTTPTYDNCINAIELCGASISGNTENTVPGINPSCFDFSYDDEENPETVWYYFIADSTGLPITISIDNECTGGGYGPYSQIFVGSISKGENCTELIEVDCKAKAGVSLSGTNDEIVELTVENPTPGSKYYLTVGGLYRSQCSFEINTSTGIETCCGQGINLNTVCNSPNEDDFFVNIEVNDLGNNPSGYIINNGAFADITTVSTVQIGPFSNNIETVTIEGKDEPDCLLTYKLENACAAQRGFTCEYPIPIEISGCELKDYVADLKTDTFSGLMPTCMNDDYYFPEGLPVADQFFEVVVPATGSVKFERTSGYFALAVYSSCDGSEIYCDSGTLKSSTNITGLPTGETVILQFWSFTESNFNFCIEEIPLPPENDECINALELCGASVSGSSINALPGDDPNCLRFPNGGDPATVWYYFIADSTGLPITISIDDECTGGGYAAYSEIFTAGIFKGETCNQLSEVDCLSKYGVNFFEPILNPIEINLLTIENPEPGAKYYLGLGGAFDSACNFEIYTSTGLKNCCNAKYSINPVCQTGDEQIYVEIQLNDLGDNPSGYSINGGTFPNITNTGLTTVGPLANEETTISIVGLDTGCELNHLISESCETAPANNTCINAEAYEVQAFGSCAYAFDYYWDAYDATNATLDLQPSCMNDENIEDYYNLFYQVVVPNSGIIHFFSFEDGLAIYDFCGGQELYCDLSINREETFRDFTSGDTLIFQILSLSEQTNFCIQEQPATPINDFCDNAISLCKGTFSGNNINATFSTDDGFNDCHAPNNTVWYNFVAESNNAVSFEFDIYDCINFFSGDGDMTFTIFGGECGGPYDEELCRNIIAPANNISIDFDNPTAGQQYLIQVSGEGDLKCSFDITVIEGVKSCCAPDISISPTCPAEEETDVFYVDIEVTDLGENPSGYLVNGGDFQNITTTGTTTIGLFENGTTTITLEGLDVANCVISETISKVCNCSTLNTTNAYRDKLIFIGDTIELDKPNFGLLGYECDFMWVTNPDNPTETYIGDDEILVLVPDTSITIYAISTCTNCKQYIVAYHLTVIDYGLCSELTTVASSRTVLFYGNYYNYSYAVELTIELEDTTECEFLYWVRDIDDPEGSIISTEQNHTVEISGGAAANFFGIASCGGEECVELITVYTPVFDIDDPDESGNPTQPDNPGQPGTPGDDGSGNIDPCPSISAGTLNTLDKYICFGEQPEVTLTDTEIPTGYSIYYAYHNSTELSTSSFVYALSFDDLVIPENVLPCATEIYLTAFIASTVSNLSEINLSDACVETSNTLEITYLCPVEIQVQEICNSNGTYNLIVTVTGGLPQVLGNLPFSIYGTVFKGNANHGQTFTITNLPDGSSYQIEAVDSEMCHDWVTGNVQCDKLPVELLTFEGEAQSNGNLLKWSTATEIDNDYFTIESSKDGVGFVELETVKGSGNTSSVSNYQFLDRQAEAGSTYYRLSQTDFDGITTIEAVTEVSRGEKSDITFINTYPVPLMDELYLQLYSNSQSGVDISLIDVTGREVIRQRFVIDKGFNEISLSTKSLPKGLYLIAMKSEAGMSYHKVIKD